MKRGNTVLEDIYRSQMRCLVCDQVWWASRVTGGRFHWGSWKCPNSCPQWKIKKNKK